MMMPRRILISGFSSVALASLSRPALAAIATPPQTEGPFYPRKTDRFPDTDHDLVRIEGAVKDAGGEVLMFGGRVTDIHGNAMPEALVEIWQCDVNGRYLHRRDFAGARQRDSHFQGYGKMRTDARGGFAFRTIKPVAYPGRTPHIHMKVHDPAGNSVLTTQIYIEGEPLNRRDGIYMRMSEAEREAVTMPLRKQTNGAWLGMVGIVL